MTAFVVRNRTEAKEKALFPFIFLRSVDRHRGDYLSAHRPLWLRTKNTVFDFIQRFTLWWTITQIFFICQLRRRFIHSSNHLLICLSISTYQTLEILSHSTLLYKWKMILAAEIEAQSSMIKTIHKKFNMLWSFLINSYMNMFLYTIEFPKLDFSIHLLIYKLDNWISSRVDII